MKSEGAIKVLISGADIGVVIKRLAAAINRDYRDKNPILIGILKGSFVFLADLIRQLDFLLEVDFVRLASYGGGTETSGEVKMKHDLQTSIEGRHVLVVEDIIDTGITVQFLMEHLKKQKPASLKLCALLDKPSRRRVTVKIDYRGIEVPDKFLVGYGLDCAEKHRNLPDICVLDE